MLYYHDPPPPPPDPPPEEPPPLPLLLLDGLEDIADDADVIVEFIKVPNVTIHVICG